MLPASLLAALEIALNRYLEAEPAARRGLERLSGGVLAVHLRELDLRLYLAPGSGGIQVLERLETAPTATVSATLPAFARLLAADAVERQSLFSGGRASLDGDAQFAERLFACLRRVAPDPEEWLARVLGDVAAHRAGVWLRGLLGWSRGTANVLGADVAEYLREETRDLVHRADVAEWMDAVDAVSADTDRLAARMERLARRRERA